MDTFLIMMSFSHYEPPFLQKDPRQNGMLGSNLTFATNSPNLSFLVHPPTPSLHYI